MTMAGRRRFDHTKIAKVRRMMKITQRDLASASGIPLDTIRQYEHGRAVPSVERLFMIADTLGCLTDDFKTGGDR